MSKPSAVPGDKATVPLRYPVEEAGVALPALSMRRPKVKDQLVVQKMNGVSEAEREVRLFANLCEVPPSTIEDLDLEDYAAVQDAYRSFRKEG